MNRNIKNSLIVLVMYKVNIILSMESTCTHNCNDVINTCVLLNFTGHQKHLNSTDDFNDFISDHFADRYLKDEDRGMTFCVNQTVFDMTNDSCWIFTHLDDDDSFNYLFKMLTDYVPDFQDETVDILDWVNATYSPCFRGVNYDCELPGMFPNIGRISLKNTKMEKRFSNINYFFDGVYTSPYFTTNASLMCILDSNLYNDVIKCLERIEIFDEKYVPISLDSSYLKTKHLLPRIKEKTFHCLPTHPFPNIAPKFPYPRVMLYLIFHSISLGFLLLHIIGSLTCENGTKYPRNIFLFFAFSLGLEMSMVMIQIVLEAPIQICVFVYFIQRFGALSSFFWIGIIGFDLWRKFQASESIRTSLSKWEKRNRIIKYSCFAWLLPFVLVTIDVSLAFLSNENSEFHHRYIAPSCLMWKELPSYIFYRIPMVIILIMNIYFFVITVFTIRKTKDMVAQQIKNSQENQLDYFSIFWKIAVLMGIHWIISVIAWITNNEMLHYFDILLTSLQNVFLFLFFTAKHCLKSFKKNTVHFFRHRLRSSSSNSSTRDEDEVTMETNVH